MSSIDVIIPCFNTQDYIVQAISSALEQTLAPTKILVIDDGSTDQTKSIIHHKYSKHKQVQYIYQQNQGLSAARNTGIKHSKSDYLAFLDADDVWMPTKLSEQMEVFRQSSYSNLGLVYCGYDLIDESGSKIPVRHFEINPKVKGDVYPLLSQRNLIASSGSGVLIKRECFSKCGLFDETLTAAEDWDMWLRISQQFQVDYVNKSLVQLRRHQTNMQINARRIFINLARVYEKHNLTDHIDAVSLQNLQRLVFRDWLSHPVNILVTIRMLQSTQPQLKHKLFENKLQLLRNFVNFIFQQLKDSVKKV